MNSYISITPPHLDLDVYGRSYVDWGRYMKGTIYTANYNNNNKVKQTKRKKKVQCSSLRFPIPCSIYMITYTVSYRQFTETHCDTIKNTINCLSTNIAKLWQATILNKTDYSPEWLTKSCLYSLPLDVRASRLQIRYVPIQSARVNG